MTVQATFPFDDGDGDDDINKQGQITNSTRFGKVKDYFAAHVDKGLYCPLCKQHAKIFKRKLNKTMVKCLRLLIKAGGVDSYKHVMTIMAHEARASREIDKIGHFGLAVSNHARKADGNKAGFWKATQLGVDFIQGRAKVRSHSIIYNAECIGYKGPEIDVNKVAPEFRLDDLMNDI